MKRPHASNDVRERALAAIDRGQSVADVARFYQNDPSTIRRWIRQRRETGSAKARPRCGRPRMLTPSQHALLEAQVAAHPDAILTWHCDAWQEHSGVRASLSTMSRWLRELGITLKKRP